MLTVRDTAFAIDATGPCRPGASSVKKWSTGGVLPTASSLKGLNVYVSLRVNGMVLVSPLSVIVHVRRDVGAKSFGTVTVNIPV